VDFTTNEEEEDTVRRDDDETGDEEAQESEQIAGDPALGVARASSNSTIRFGRSSDDDEDRRKAPRKDVIPLFEELGLAISAHDHLVEVEGNTEGPAEVCEQEIVHHDGDEYATAFIFGHRRFIGSNEHGIPDNNTYA